MLSPAILFTATKQEVELQRLLQLTQQQIVNEGRDVQDERFEADSIDQDRYEPSKRPNIADLLHIAFQIKERQKDRNDDLNENNVDDGRWYGSQSNKKDRGIYNDDVERNKRHRHDDEALEQLLSQSNLDKKHTKDEGEGLKQNRYNEEVLEQLLSQNVLDKKPQRYDDGYNKYTRYNEEALKQLLSQGVLDKLQKKDNYKYDNERLKPSRYNEEALNKLLSENVLDKKIQPRHKLVPNTLLGSFELENDRIEDRNNLGGYSKVYVILNPEAIAKSTNKQKLNDLLTKVLSLTAPSGLERKNRNRPKKYKGFSIVPEVLSRRARRESREMYGKDSIEEDYRPKRQRGERGGGGGGGGAGGRTAIPYIRHRGDIYERDN